MELGEVAVEPVAAKDEGRYRRLRLAPSFDNRSPTPTRIAAYRLTFSLEYACSATIKLRVRQAN